MKKVGLLLFFLACMVWSAQSQVEYQYAMGLRFGGGNGFNSELSFQYGLSEQNRLEFDLGVRNNKDYQSWGLTGMYQWVWHLQDRFNWFVGFGAKIGSWSWDDDPAGKDSDGFFMSVPGNIGIEYLFDIGLQVAVDFKPEIGIINHADDLNLDLGLAIRYQF